MEINGLPLHPLVVHAAVVFGSVGALSAVVYGSVSRFRQQLRWPMLALALMAVASIVAAYITGDDFLAGRPDLATNPQVQTHEERAEILLWATIVFGVVAIGAGMWHRRAGALRYVVDIVLILSALTVLYFVISTGDAGARAVWG
jgi:hypothetical protein